MFDYLTYIYINANRTYIIQLENLLWDGNFNMQLCKWVFYILNSADITQILISQIFFIVYSKITLLTISLLIHFFLLRYEGPRTSPSRT